MSSPPGLGSGDSPQQILSYCPLLHLLCRQHDKTRGILGLSLGSRAVCEWAQQGLLGAKWEKGGGLEQAGWNWASGCGDIQNSSAPWHFMVGLVARFKQLRHGFLRRPRVSTKGLPLPGLQHKNLECPSHVVATAPLTTLSALPQITVAVEAEAAGTAMAQADRPTIQGHMGAMEALGVAPHT